MRLPLVLIAALSFASLASAQSTEPREPANVKTERLRLSLGAGLSVVYGPDSEVDGARVEDDGPGSLPMPSAVARAELVLSELFLVGVQSALFMWEVGSDRYFGANMHTTIDVSALLRLRISFGSYARHELVASIPFGPSFDIYELGPRTYGAELERNFSWHAGLFGGYQYAPVRNPVGFFVEAGLIYHRVSWSLEFGNATEELSYEPIEALIRGGLLLPIR